MNFLATLLFLLLLPGTFVLQAAPKPQDGLPKTTLSVGTNELSAQIAADDATRELGLMSHSKLGDEEGMIFVFPHPRPVAFWMKDTPIPLSVAYISSSGRILEIHDMKPFDETAIPSASSSVVYALEVSQGWFPQHGVLAGDTIGGLPSPAMAK
jgi:uncharacterized membrane protein (UPF0127 family)